MEVLSRPTRAPFYTHTLSLISHLTPSVVVQLQAHAIVDLVVGQRDVVLREETGMG